MLWPITKAGETAEVFCSNVNPSFGFGPYATRQCRESETWSGVDTSQCSIRPQQQSTIVVYSTYIEVESININDVTSAEIEQVSNNFVNVRTYMIALICLFLFS